MSIRDGIRDPETKRAAMTMPKVAFNETVTTAFTQEIATTLCRPTTKTRVLDEERGVSRASKASFKHPTESIKIITKSVVCEDSTLVGDITIMQGCVIHTSATIIAEAGPLILGENCIVEEYATIIHRNSEHKELSTLTIGSNNIFEVGCTVEAYKIGEKNLFESKCYVGSNVAVASGCIIGAGIRINQVVELPENTVIYRDSNQQREAIEKHTSQTLQIDFLRKVLPNYHHLRKPNCDSKKIKIAV